MIHIRMEWGMMGRGSLFLLEEGVLASEARGIIIWASFAILHGANDPGAHPLQAALLA